MATYKVWLTVKDSYGNTKEVDGGTINVDLDTLTKDEINHIEEALPLENYVLKTELDEELDNYATEVEVSDVVTEVVQNTSDVIKYADFDFSE